jgi:hypothetical protein
MMIADETAAIARNLRIMRCPMAPHVGTMVCSCGYEDTKNLAEIRRAKNWNIPGWHGTVERGWQKEATR